MKSLKVVMLFVIAVVVNVAVIKFIDSKQVSGVVLFFSGCLYAELLNKIETDDDTQR